MVLYLFRFIGVPWIYLFFLLGRSKRQCCNRYFRRAISTATKKLLIVSDPWLVLLRPNISFSPVLKLVHFNLVSYFLGNSSLFICLCCFQNSFCHTTFLNILREISRSAWTDFYDCYGTNWLEVPMKPCWTSFCRFSILEAWAIPWSIRRWLLSIHK